MKAIQLHHAPWSFPLHIFCMYLHGAPPDTAVETFGGEAFRQRLGLVPISAGERAQRLLAQSAMQSGMITVYNSVLMQSKDSAEFYIKVRFGGGPFESP